MTTPGEQSSFYDQIGGEETFRRLVGEFYVGVAGDPELRALYPEDDLGPAADRLALFLMQYWGGPATYSRTHGHPRLRMRHAPFVIDTAQRERWLRHMRAALDRLELPPEQEKPLWDYLQTAAGTLQNHPD
ncbi:MAG TPA: globin [Jatrophihabitans sp.]